MNGGTHDISPQFLGGDSLLLISEVARFLRVSDKTIRRMITGGKLRSVKVCGKRVIRMSDLNELVRGQAGGANV